MNNQTRGIITLLRGALNGENLTLPEDFDWQSASTTFYIHQLVALAVRGAPRCGVSLTRPELKRLMALFCADVNVSRAQMQQLNRIFAAFGEKGIHYLPVKGAIIKPLYPQPEMRAMGDADVLIRYEQYPAIRDILLSLGMEEEGERDHECVWKSKELTLELHKHLIPSDNRDYYSYYSDCWAMARQVGDTTAYRLSPEDHFIYLIVHFAKHYRNGTISAKNVCDFHVWRKACPDMDETYIEAEMDKLGLSAFYRNLLDLLDCWFAGGEATPAVEAITDTVLRGGILDTEASQTASAALKMQKETTSLSKGKWRWLLERVFPPKSYFALRYPVVSKWPVLLPFFWVGRWFRMLLRSPGQVKRGLSVSRQMMRSDTQLLTEYEAQLHTVGLDFNVPGETAAQQSGQDH